MSILPNPFLNKPRFDGRKLHDECICICETRQSINYQSDEWNIFCLRKLQFIEITMVADDESECVREKRADTSSCGKGQRMPSFILSQQNCMSSLMTISPTRKKSTQISKSVWIKRTLNRMRPYFLAAQKYHVRLLWLVFLLFLRFSVCIHFSGSFTANDTNYNGEKEKKTCSDDVNCIPCLRLFNSFSRSLSHLSFFHTFFSRALPYLWISLN